MSATLPFDATHPADNWPMSEPVGHAIELSSLFAPHLSDRTDAWRAETRRHLAGCLRSIETAIRLSLAHEPLLTGPLARLDDPLCWPFICRHPALVSPSLLRHMRLRAGVGMILRQRGREDEHNDEGVSANLFDATDRPVVEAAALLAIAEGRWAMRGSEDQPMRPDLPAERFAELVWMVVAILARAVEPALNHSSRPALAIVAEAGRTLLARHDEAASPVALADRLVSLLGRAADDPALRARAIAQRRLPLFTALAAHQLKMDSLSVLDLLLTEPIGHVSALCSALGVSDVEARHLLLAMQGGRISFTDPVILTEVERYTSDRDDSSSPLLVLLTAPPLLRATVARLGAMASS